MSQQHVEEFVRLVHGKPAKELGPAILYINHLSMDDMLAGLDKLDDNDRTHFREAAFDGIPEKFAFDKVLPEAKQVGIKRIQFAFDTVVKKKVPSYIVDDLYETGQVLTAYMFLKGSIPTKNVWLSAINETCEDARLQEHNSDREGTGTVLTVDTVHGQAGWDMAVSYAAGVFSTIHKQLATRCRPHMINKLGINAHGQPGEVAVNGVFFGRDNPQDTLEPIHRVATKPALNVKTMRNVFGDVLDFINHVMVPTGTVGFYSCLAGRGLEGDNFLKMLSLEIKPRKVMAFTTLGYTSKDYQLRKSYSGFSKCMEPGVRDTNMSTEGSEESQYKRYHKSGDMDDLKKMPWQSETATHVKIAQFGNIVHQGVDAT